jgi:hypothetical protein
MLSSTSDRFCVLRSSLRVWRETKHVPVSRCSLFATSPYPCSCNNFIACAMASCAAIGVDTVLCIFGFQTHPAVVKLSNTVRPLMYIKRSTLCTKKVAVNSMVNAQFQAMVPVPRGPVRNGLHTRKALQPCPQKVSCAKTTEKGSHAGSIMLPKHSRL